MSRPATDDRRPRLLQAVALLLGLSATAGAQEITPRNIPMNAGNHHVWLEVGEHRREYLIHVPESYDGKRKVPVLFMFHGSGGSSDETYRATGWNLKSDEKGFLAVFPNGFPNDEGMRVWNDGRRAMESPMDDVAFTRTMLEDLGARFQIDHKRIYVVGFSNGAGLSDRLAQELGDRIAAIAPVAGRIGNPDSPIVRPVPAFAVVGTQDAGYPNDTRSAERWAALLSCGPAADSARDGRYLTISWRCPRDLEVKSTIVDNWAHYWPGGTLNKGVEMWAEEKIWRFFEKHPLK